MRTSPLFLLWSIVFADLPLAVLHAAPADTPHIQYVGAISINPNQDAKVLADWYAKFGIETHESSGGFYGTWTTPAGPFFFGIHPKRKASTTNGSSNISVVFRVDDYDGYLSAVRGRGLQPEGTEQDSEGRFAHFKDPDGNEVTLWGK